MTTKNILEHIRLGTDYKEWFNYDGEPLPIRPLSTYEIDEIIKKVIREGISPQTYDSIIKLKLNILSPEQKRDISISDYQEYLTYFNEIDYWIVYYAMKDFQPEKFSKPDFDGDFQEFKNWDENNPKGYYIVKKMKYVHDIAKDVKNMTSQPTTVLMEVLENKTGQALASLVYRYHVPLANKAWELTPLQTYFLIFSAPDAPQIVKDESELPGIKSGTLKEVTEQLRKMGMI